MSALALYGGLSSTYDFDADMAILLLLANFERMRRLTDKIGSRGEKKYFCRILELGCLQTANGKEVWH